MGQFGGGSGEVSSEVIENLLIFMVIQQHGRDADLTSPSDAWSPSDTTPIIPPKDNGKTRKPHGWDDTEFESIDENFSISKSECLSDINSFFLNFYLLLSVIIIEISTIFRQSKSGRSSKKTGGKADVAPKGAGGQKSGPASLRPDEIGC